MKDGLHFETRAIHAGEPRPLIHGAVTMPLFHSSTYEYVGPEDGPQARYTRLDNTPNQLCVEQKLAALEGGEAAVVMATGMAAISTSLLHVVPAGRHLLAQDSLYGGTYAFLQDSFPKLGRHVSFFDAEDPSSLPRMLRPDTAAIYVESVSNPLMKVPELAAVVDFARANRLVTLIDNTFPSPFNFNPLAMGFDVVLHSATKYLNGHSDIVGGAAVGAASLMTPIRKLMATLGPSMDANSCFLLNRGLKTLPIRMRWHNESAAKLAAALEKHSRVARLLYSGNHERARKYFRGQGGMLSFEYDGTGEDCVKFLRRLKLASIAPSLGGVETLVTRPVTTSHAYMSKEELKQMGIRDTLVRVSVGLENPDDLIADFVGALDG